MFDLFYLLFAIFAILTVIRFASFYSIFKYIKLNHHQTYLGYFSKDFPELYYLLFAFANINMAIDLLFTKKLHLDKYLMEKIPKYTIITLLHILSLLLLLGFFFF